MLIEFRLGAVTPDNSRDPALITSLAPITLPALTVPAVTRTFKFGKSGGAWTFNRKIIDCSRVHFTMKRGRPERWIFKTCSGWAHPIHNHFVEGRIVRRNGVTIGPGHYEYCRKDVVALYSGDTIE